MKLIKFLDWLFPAPTKSRFDFSIFRTEQAKAELLKVLPACQNLPAAALSYKNDTVRALIWQIKYKRNPDAFAFGGFALRRLLSGILEKEYEKQYSKYAVPAIPALSILTIVIIPIPISRTRRRERGYNQCELLAHALVKSFEKIGSDAAIQIRRDFTILVRKKHIKKQTFKNRRERLEGIGGVFEVRPDNAYKKIKSGQAVFIVLDDVITTGATIREAIQCLRRAGFSRVHGIALAH